MIVSYANKKQEEKLLGQVNLFDMGGDDMPSMNGADMLDIHHVDDFDDREKLLYEAELMGIYVSGHPLDRYQGVIEQMASMPISQIQSFDGQGKRDMILAGMIVEKKDIMTKKGDRMCFATLEDLTGKIECIVFPKTFAEFSELLSTDEPIILTGQVNLSEEPRKFFPSKIQKLKEEAEQRVTSVRINVKMEGINLSRIDRLKQILLGYRGSVPLHLVFENDLGRARIPLGESFLVNPTPQMAAKVNEILDDNAVRFVVDGRLEEVVINQ